MTSTIHINIDGMTCTNCQNRIQRKLRNTNGIINAKISYNEGTGEVIYDEEKISPEKISSIIKALGYEINNKDHSTNFLYKLEILTSIIIIYALLRSTGILNFLVPGQLADSNMSYGMLFIIGLFTSVHCVAMCGGINLSQSLADLHTFSPAIAYNFGRVISYTIIGGILGFVGLIAGGSGQIGFSMNLQSALKLIAGSFMVIMGINMLNLFPPLRKYALRMPKFIADKIFIAKIGNSKPFIIGLLNGLMPCGPLQSMWLVALASANIFAGALSMLSFGLGTMPLMLGLGSVVSSLGRKFTKKIMTSGAVLVVVLGLVMISQGWNLGSWFHSSAFETQELNHLEGLQVINSTLSSGSYPNIEVKAGIPVEWRIDAPKGSINGCNYKFIIYEYGIEHTFKTGENVVNFIPTKAGVVNYACWMGMIEGKIFVTN